MDFGRALTFPFDDDDWMVKFVIGSLIMIVGVFLPFIPLGYQVHVARNVMQEKKRPLPGSDSLGEVMADGLYALMGALVYWIPATPVCCMLLFFGGVMGDSGLGGLLFACVALCLSGFLFLYGIVAAALFWMGVIRFAETGNFNEFLRIGGLWEDVRSHMPTALGLLIYSLAFGVLISLVAAVSVVTCVGPLVVAFYAQVVSGHLIGQAGLEITRGDWS
jgi:hypothetical protein